MKRLLVILLLVAVLVLIPVSGAFAATSQTVTVTAVPSFISISNAPTTWTINGITGSGVIATSTTYYTNPLGDTTAPSATVVDGECRFTITNTSTVATDITVNFADFSGGDAMTNSGTGSAGASTFGAYGYYSGMTFSNKVVAKSSGSSALMSNLSATTNLKWGLQVSTRTSDWTSGSTQTATVTVTATSH